MESFVIWLMQMSGYIVGLVVDPEAHGFIVYQMLVAISLIVLVAALLAFWPLWHLKKRSQAKKAGP
ncbi:hypothetical protein [Rheinheimera sp.]|uniref:hypothetical protein n=1 Tax=Rheinheimera sp. TaxID=1869214 RepID=UPI00307F8F2C